MDNMPDLENIMKDAEKIKEYKSNIIKIIDYMGQNELLNAKYHKQEDSDCEDKTIELFFNEGIVDKYDLNKYNLQSKNPKKEKIYGITILNKSLVLPEGFVIKIGDKNNKTSSCILTGDNIWVKVYDLLLDLIKNSYETHKKFLDGNLGESLKNAADAIDSKK